MNKGIIYIRIEDGGFESVLAYQEAKLEELAKGVQIQEIIVDIGDSFQSHPVVQDHLEYYILNELINCIYIYSPYRLSSDASIIEEFEMLCAIHDVKIQYYKDYRMISFN